MALEHYENDLSVARTVTMLQGELPQIAGAVIGEYQDMSLTENQLTTVYAPNTTCCIDRP